LQAQLSLEAALARAKTAPAALALEALRRAAAVGVAAGRGLVIRLIATAVETGEVLCRGRTGEAIAAVSRTATAAAVSRTSATAAVSRTAAARRTATVTTKSGTGGPPRPLLGGVDVEATTTDVALIEEANRFRRLLLRRERREREPARSACHSIGRDVHIDNLARFRENLGQLLLRRGVAQVPDKNLGRNGESPSCALLTAPTRE
jgi:hypothetical protein